MASAQRRHCRVPRGALVADVCCGQSLAVEEIRLSGGSVAATVVRVGDTARRSVDRWSPAVHACHRGHPGRPHDEGRLRGSGVAGFDWVPDRRGGVVHQCRPGASQTSRCAEATSSMSCREIQKPRTMAGRPTGSVVQRSARAFPRRRASSAWSGPARQPALKLRARGRGREPDWRRGTRRRLCAQCRRGRTRRPSRTGADWT